MKNTVDFPIVLWQKTFFNYYCHLYWMVLIMLNTDLLDWHINLPRLFFMILLSFPQIVNHILLNVVSTEFSSALVKVAIITYFTVVACGFIFYNGQYTDKLGAAIAIGIYALPLMATFWLSAIIRENKIRI